jgi:amidase
VAPELGDAVDGLAIDHVVTRSVRDSAAALDAIAGNVPGDPYWAPPAPSSWLDAMEQRPRPLRVAFSSRKLDGNAMHPDCEAAVRHAAKLCAGLGHEVDEAAQHFDLSVLVPAFLTVWSANLAAAVDLVAKLTGQTPVPDLFEGLTWGMYEAGRRVGASEYLVAKDALQCASRRAAKFHETHDVWLMPTLGTPPMKNGVFDIEERDIYKGFLPLFDYVPFTAFQNVTGQPAVNLPLFWNTEGLPIGVQFAAPFGDEKTLFQLARQLEEAAPWWDHYARARV